MRWVALVVALVVVGIAGVMLGTMHLAPAGVLRALAGQGSDVEVAVVRSLRLPRVVLAALVGAGLGSAGAALQGATRNGLAEPYLLGVSGGAAVGAVLAVAAGAAFALLPLAAFGGAVGAVMLAFFVARASATRGDARVLLMAGVIVGALANAVIMIVLATAPANTVRGALWWMMGSVADATWSQVTWLALYLAAGGGALLMLARRVDVLALGEEAAAGLGLDVERSARAVYVVASLLAAATVAVAGLVGFVGLVVPHLARRWGARRHRPIFVSSALWGATLLILADVVARILRPPAELPLGAVTAVVGVPLFLAQLRRVA